MWELKRGFEGEMWRRGRVCSVNNLVVTDENQSARPCPSEPDEIGRSVEKKRCRIRRKFRDVKCVFENERELWARMCVVERDVCGEGGTDLSEEGLGEVRGDGRGVGKVEKGDYVGGKDEMAVGGGCWQVVGGVWEMVGGEMNG